MPPSRRTAPPVDPAPLLADVWRATAAAALVEPDLAVRAAVIAELGRQLTDTAAMLGRPGTGTAARTLAEYLRAVQLPSTTRSEAEPAPRPADEYPAEALAPALDGAIEVLGAATTDVVDAPAGPVDRRVFLEERLLGAAAIGLDLSEALVPERAVLRLCVRLLARALAELAPGRSVEVRVPPYVAVQCVEGPRHTRGTPPNVVEVDPVAFLELASGRRSWDSGLATGLVRASGERADLRPWLPLMGRTVGADGG